MSINMHTLIIHYKEQNPFVITREAFLANSGCFDFERENQCTWFTDFAVEAWMLQ